MLFHQIDSLNRIFFWLQNLHHVQISNQKGGNHIGPHREDTQQIGEGNGDSQNDSNDLFEDKEYIGDLLFGDLFIGCEGPLEEARLSIGHSTTRNIII